MSFPQVSPDVDGSSSVPALHKVVCVLGGTDETAQLPPQLQRNVAPRLGHEYHRSVEDVVLGALIHSVASNKIDTDSQQILTVLARPRS